MYYTSASLKNNYVFLLRHIELDLPKVLDPMGLEALKLQRVASFRDMLVNLQNAAFTLYTLLNIVKCDILYCLTISY